MDKLKTVGAPVERFGSSEKAKSGGKGDNLKSEITLTIHTRHAQILWSGRKKSEDKSGIKSFPAFARDALILEQSVKKDDPYADYYFYQVHNQIIEARQKVQAFRTSIEEMIQSNLPEGITMTRNMSVTPMQIELNISSKLGFLAAYLLADFDLFSRQLQLAKHTAIIDTESASSLQRQCQHAFRSVLHSLNRWKFTDVTRDDIAANNQTARTAKERMGELEADFITGDKRSPIAPPITKQSGLGQISRPPEGVEGDISSFDTNEQNEPVPETA